MDDYNEAHQKRLATGLSAKPAADKLHAETGPLRHPFLLGKGGPSIMSESKMPFVKSLPSSAASTLKRSFIPIET